jgi:flagellar motor component MotA
VEAGVMEKFSGIIKAGSIMGAFLVLTGATVKALDYTETRPVILKEFRVVMDQVQQNTQATLLIRYQLLDAKRKSGTLTVEESIERCQIAMVLNYPLSVIGGCQ